VSVTTAPLPPALAPQARPGCGEVTVTVFHETHTHGALLGEDIDRGHRADGRTFAHYAGLLDRQRRRLQAGSSLFVGNGDDLSDKLGVPAVFGGGAAVQTGAGMRWRRSTPPGWMPTPSGATTSWQAGRTFSAGWSRGHGFAG
jgi:hypothetical protein